MSATSNPVTEKPCPSGHRDCKGIAAAPHPCPFREDMNNDAETLCECCENCAHECAMDI